MDMASHIDEKFNYCAPASISPTGILIPQGSNAGLISQAYEMAITVGIKSNNTCEKLLQRMLIPIK